MSVNMCFFIGNLGADVEVKTFESGDRSATFSIASTKKYTNKAGEKVENTTWINIVAYGNVVDVCEKYLKKGSKVHVGTEYRNRKSEKDGKTYYFHEFVLRSLEMLGSKQENVQTATVPPPDNVPSDVKTEGETEPKGFDNPEDDLPF